MTSHWQLTTKTYKTRNKWASENWQSIKAVQWVPYLPVLSITCDLFHFQSCIFKRPAYREIKIRNYRKDGTELKQNKRKTKKIITEVWLIIVKINGELMRWTWKCRQRCANEMNHKIDFRDMIRVTRVVVVVKVHLPWLKQDRGRYRLTQKQSRPYCNLCLISIHSPTPRCRHVEHHQAHSQQSSVESPAPAVVAEAAVCDVCRVHRHYCSPSILLGCCWCGHRGVTPHRPRTVGSSNCRCRRRRRRQPVVVECHPAVFGAPVAAQQTARCRRPATALRNWKVSRRRIATCTSTPDILRSRRRPDLDPAAGRSRTVSARFGLVPHAARSDASRRSSCRHRRRRRCSATLPDRTRGTKRDWIDGCTCGWWESRKRGRTADLIPTFPRRLPGRPDCARHPSIDQKKTSSAERLHCAWRSR